MEDTKNRTIADTFNAKLKTPWVWVIILVTLGLTALFYISQKPEAVVYSRYIKSLSDYQLMELDLMRSMNQVRCGYNADSVRVLAQTMSLRELAVSYSRDMDEFASHGIATPPRPAIAKFEREVFSKVAGIRRYLSVRRAWLNKFESVYAEVSDLPGVSAYLLLSVLDSARFGFPVQQPRGIAPDSLSAKIDTLLAENAELAMAWSRFDNHVAIMSSEEMIQFFQKENMNEMALKAKIPLVFYFLTIVLLLSTFFFIFKSKS
ncbi:hypothetical protein [Fibrobacter sp. UBA3629]|uniref:hypothetical protein n=1 Tax=Fibrobacter sp. UBA3629 TaxID=1946530 RepID=UPI0015677F36|nr:hypothetical protein [Fibrobacter sp. UBA3629]